MTCITCLLAFCLPGMWTIAAPAHDFHLSRTVLRYLAEHDEVQIEMHVFLDDLERALSEAGAPSLQLGTEAEKAGAEAYLKRYLDLHFNLRWNGRALDRQLVGYELSEDMQALWIYMQARPQNPPASVEVQQSMLTEIYADQRNLVQLDLGPEGRHNLLMDSGHTRESWHK